MIGACLKIVIRFNKKKNRCLNLCLVAEKVEENGFLSSSHGSISTQKQHEEK
jgi:hypothetical protein